MARSLSERIDSLSIHLGKLVAWVVLGNIGALVYEFLARHFFQSPTVWSYDMTYFLYGTHFLLGAAYTLYLRSHIRIEIFYQRLSPRGQAISDMAGYLIFFFPVMLILIYAGMEFAGRSFEINEKSGLSPWRPYLYPYKVIVTLSLFFLMLQGVAEFLRSAAKLKKGK
jgi:TRAP-type mannitol/chloroaromatic compound transport system permease small subunit